MQIWRAKTVPDSEVDFESLPPIVQRKFFSNAERLRIRLAQGDPVDGLNYPSNVACAPRPGLHSRSLRSRRGVPVASKPTARRRRPFQKPLLSGPVQKFRKSPRPLPTVCLATQAELEWFLALPPKIQQRHFSVEERSRLRQACWNTEILDPADEALYRFHQSRKSLSSEALSLEGTTLPTSPSSIPYLAFSSDTSDDDSDDVDDDDMDASFYDSFRWLDEDGELDLTLDEYRPHVSNSTSDLPSRQRPSFRRTLSLNSVGLSRRMSSSVAPRKVPNSSQSSNVPSALMHAGRGSTTRPPSRQKQSYHAPRSSTSSIDPSAQYYQDPEARLKLRVYLASPQKFDEAIEFGFPSLGDKGTRSPQRAPGDFQTKCHDFIGTFLEDDDASVTSDIDESHPDRSRFSYTTSGTPSSHDLPFRTNKRQTWVPTSQSAPYRQPKNREMTLKMTLTRPDLRTDSGTPSPPAIDPLKPGELPSTSGGIETWDTDKTDQSLMKKVWRRIRGQGS